MTILKIRRGKYKEWVFKNPIVSEGEIIAVTELPWYLSWFSLKPVRFKYGIGKTFKETRFI